ncbi:MAG TPA: NADPH-dependent FMN reductase [Flavitalea sp.]|nr:NADPH-dependent FMN reductase [Flavitalea sp.]
MMDRALTILALCGSLREDSSNAGIIKVISKMLPGHIRMLGYNGIASLPHFDGNEEAAQSVIEFRNAITAADGILICSPEYAFGVPGSFKNALDWTVSSGSLSEKPAALITASTGGEKAHAAMLNILTALNAKLIQETTLLISFIRSKLNSNGEITDEKTDQQLNALTNAFVQLIEREQSSAFTADKKHDDVPMK